MKKKAQEPSNGGNQKLNTYKLSALITVVNRSKADFYTDLIQSYNVNMQMGMLANGTAKQETLAYLGLANTEKTVILSVVREDKLPQLLDVLEQKFNTIRDGKGIAYTVPMSAIIGVAAFGFLADNRNR